MRRHLLWGVAGVLAVILAGTVQRATAAEPGRLAAFTARQGLRDEVCIAMADGHISRGERFAILTHAKPILKPAEYEGLKRAMDRISPPTVAAGPRATEAAPSQAPQQAGRRGAWAAGATLGPVVPASAILPDRMAGVVEAR
jgi:hypothetical protein